MDPIDNYLSRRLKNYAASHNPPQSVKLRIMQAARNPSQSHKYSDRKPALVKRYMDGSKVSPWYSVPFDLQSPYSFQWGIASRIR